MFWENCILKIRKEPDKNYLERIRFMNRKNGSLNTFIINQESSAGFIMLQCAAR